MIRMDAYEWLESGNEIYFTDDSLVAESESLVEGLFEQGAKKVEAIAYPGATETSTLAIGLTATDFPTMLETMFEVAILTPSGPIIKEADDTILVTWGPKRQRLSSSMNIAIAIKGNLYRIDPTLNLKKPKPTDRIDFGGLLDDSVIQMFHERGALTEPDVCEDEDRAIILDVTLPVSYDRALECMIFLALLGLDVSSTIDAEPGSRPIVSACAVDDLL